MRSQSIPAPPEIVPEVAPELGGEPIPRRYSISNDPFFTEEVKLAEPRATPRSPTGGSILPSDSDANDPPFFQLPSMVRYGGPSLIEDPEVFLDADVPMNPQTVERRMSQTKEAFKGLKPPKKLKTKALSFEEELRKAREEAARRY